MEMVYYYGATQQNKTQEIKDHEEGEILYHSGNLLYKCCPKL